MFLEDDKIQKLKCVIGYFNVICDEKCFEKNDLQCFGAINESARTKSGHLGLDPV